MGQLSARDYAEWAGEMLMQGFDSRSLRITAGLDSFVSAFEAENYFFRSVQELGLAVPEPESAIRAYACGIAQEIIEGHITGQEGVRMLYAICVATEYNRDFIVWYELDDARTSLLFGDYPFTYESATLENFDEIAKQEAVNFIATVCSRSAT